MKNFKRLPFAILLVFCFSLPMTAEGPVIEDLNDQEQSANGCQHKGTLC